MTPVYLSLRVCERFGIDPSRIGVDVATVGGRVLLEAFEMVRRAEDGAA